MCHSDVCESVFEYLLTFLKTMGWLSIISLPGVPVNIPQWLYMYNKEFFSHWIAPRIGRIMLVQTPYLCIGLIGKPLFRWVMWHMGHLFSSL